MVVESVGKALGSNLTSRTDGLRPVLCRTLNEERVRVGSPAGGFRGPVVIKHPWLFPPPAKHECLTRAPDGTPTDPVPLGSNELGLYSALELYLRGASGNLSTYADV